MKKRKEKRIIKSGFGLAKGIPSFSKEDKFRSKFE